MIAHHIYIEWDDSERKKYASDQSYRLLLRSIMAYAEAEVFNIPYRLNVGDRIMITIPDDLWQLHDDSIDWSKYDIGECLHAVVAECVIELGGTDLCVYCHEATITS